MSRQHHFAIVFVFVLIPVFAARAEPSSSISTERGTIRVRDGFTIERVAGPPLVGHPMLANFDERGRLFIAESAGKNLRPAELETELPNFVRMLEDTDGDGTFDKSTIFADRMTLPMGALPYRGSVYVAAPPNIWRLQDTDDDGVADKREILVGKFGYNGNAASIHGPFLSPTGRIYWCDGRHGHEFRDDVGAVTSKKRGSGIFSMRPDGSDVRMFCGGGMDNPVEVDFMPTGEVIGSVNILYTNPRIDCLVHWQDGGVYPHQEASIAEFTQTGDLLGPITKFGHVAVSGMCRYRSSVLGVEYKDTIFTSIFNSGKVMVSKIERAGGTFRTTETEFLTSDDPDFHPTDVLEDADGSLLLIDTGGWFRIGCPTSQIAKPDIAGAIYRIRRTGSGSPDKRVVDPRGTKLDFAALTISSLVDLLDDERPAVRERSIEELSLRRNFDQRLTPYFELDGEPDLSVEGRVHLIWAIARQGNHHRIKLLGDLLGNPYQPESIRIAAATALADLMRVPDRKVALDENLQVVFDKAVSSALRRSVARLIGVAYEGHGKRLDRSPDGSGGVVRLAVRGLLQRLGRDQGTHQEPTDRQTVHAIILAAIRIADRYGVLPLLSHASPVVRRAALITLDQMEGDNLSREAVVSLLDTDDEPLRTAALDVISRHDGWASGTLSLLGSWLHDGHLSPERTSMIRGFLRTQTSDESVQKLVADLLLDPKLPQASRLLLLEVVAESGLPALPASWELQLSASLASSYSAVRHQAVRTAAAFDTAAFDKELLTLAHDDQQSVDLRIDALAAAADRRTEVSNAEFAFLLSQLVEDAAPLQKLGAARTMVRLPLSESQRLKIAEQIGISGPLTVGVLLHEFSSDLNSELTQAVLKSLNDLPDEVRLPKAELLAFLKSTPEPLRSDVQNFVDSRLSEASNEAALQQRQSQLTAGNAERGREIFFGKITACSSCHTVAGQGGKVGPDLTKIGAIRKQRDLLEAIMFPGASFARGYNSWTIVTDHGRVHSGLITRETADSLMLRKADLSEVRISRNSIEEMSESTTSVMPNGLDHRLTNQDLSDLLEYLSSLK
ncbi:MAG: c-type cytochrome [Planctomycetota bacterium]|nr:c-type cytochrome [Planctomycetota bacterium]MDA0917936.1 c-type cytochrome [Planctomycetota bacterium]